MKHLNRRTKLAIWTALLALVLLSLYLFGLLLPDSAMEGNFLHAKEPPSLAHPFGTDALGRDLLLRTVKGLSISLSVGLIASCISAAIAVVAGAAAAASRRWLDGAVNWLIDLTMGIPHIVLILLLSFLFGRGMKGLIVGIAATHWCSLARVIRGEALQIREQHYVALSRRLGKGDGWILRHHFLPQLLPQLLVGLLFMLPHAILHEAAVSFLGYGLPPEQPAIGIILSESMKYLSAGMWWAALFPGLTLFLVVLLIDRLGENLQKVLDPYSAQE